MGWREDNNRIQQKEDLIDGIKSVLGYEPDDIRLVLRTMSHPSIVADVRRYFETLDPGTMCLTYEAPWNCARESEAQFNNLTYGGLGASPINIGGVGWWCEPCKKRVMGED